MNDEYYELKDAREILNRSDTEKSLRECRRALREISEELEEEPETKNEKIQTGYIRAARELVKKALELEDEK